MPELTVIIFHSGFKAELIRYIFHQAGKSFKDERLTKEQWSDLKPKTPMGQMPVLEVDGKMVAQSVAVARYLANEFGLAGKDNWEKALADMYVDGVGDLYAPRRQVMDSVFAGDYAKATEEFKKFQEEAYNPFLERGILGQKSIWLAYRERGMLLPLGLQCVWNLLKITWADLSVAEFTDRMLAYDPSSVDKFPKVKAHKDRVHSDPKIKAYVDTRPVTKI